MSYAVKELFRTLQGEGAQAGRLAVFCRFTGCNLWSGRQADRGKGLGGCSNWCDTDFVGTDGPGGGKYSADELADTAWATWGHAPGQGQPYLVCTGGEPLLQLDPELIGAFRARGFTIAIETNGTIEVPDGIDWVCVSPKEGGQLIVREGQELKIVVPQPGLDLEELEALSFDHHFVQPMDGPQLRAATEAAIELCHRRPTWRLSLQTHKFANIP